MRLVVKQKVFSWFGKYNIFNEMGEVVYQVKGELSWGKLLRVYDANDMELGYVKEKVITLLPKFEFYMQGGLIGTMNKKFTFLKPKYLLDFNGWSIEGDVWGLNYQILNGTEPIAMVNKKFISVADEYTIDVFNDQNDVLALLIVLAVDIDKARSDNDAAASININS